MSESLTEITIGLPRLHGAQNAIRNSSARRKVVCAGRRGGKTTLAAIESVRRLFKGERILLCSATQDQADAFWQKVTTWCADAISIGVLKRNESRRILECAQTGGRLRVKTASNPDALRGDHCDFLVLDECAILPADIWEAVGPMLIDSDGTCYMLSSPRPRGAFRDLYARAQQDTTGRWAAFHFTTYDNPHLKQQAIDDLAADLTDAARRQELEAEFLESESTVFRNISACLVADDQRPEDHVKHDVVIGVDWAQTIDYTVISVYCGDCRRELELDRFNRIEWALQRGRLRALADKWKASEILVERNSIGQPNLEALRDEGLAAIGFTTTQQSKAKLIQSLALAFEREEAGWLDLPFATAELEAFEATISGSTGRVSYGAPQGLHDDTVIARALALRQAQIESWEVINDGDLRQVESALQVGSLV